MCYPDPNKGKTELFWATLSLMRPSELKMYKRPLLRIIIMIEYKPALCVVTLFSVLCHFPFSFFDLVMAG